MATSIRVLIALVVGSTVLTACGGSLFGSGSDDSIEGQWLITSISVGGTMVDPVEGSDPYLNINPERLTGNTGCNNFFTSVEFGSDGSWSAGDLGMTMMACTPDLTVQETAITAHIGAADEWTVDGDAGKLLLDGDTLLELERLDSNLAGTDWEITGVNNGNEAVVSIITGTEVTLSFDDEGGVGGTGGCNSFGGGYVAGDEVIHIDDVFSTMMFCMTPEGVMDQEAQFLAALANAHTYSISGSTLTMRDAGGATQITANRK